MPPALPIIPIRASTGVTFAPPTTGMQHPEDNAATFLLTNIVPQAPRHNREVWKNLEDYERQLMSNGNDVYIIAGTSGTGGTGQNGYATSLANGKLTVPATLWKILVVVPASSDNTFQLTENTRVIAVNIPNNQSAADKPWQAYLTSVDASGKAYRLRFPIERTQLISSVLLKSVSTAAIVN